MIGRLPMVAAAIFENPRVTLAMPVFNGEAYIAIALRSLLAQTFENFEIVITDNASTDRTEIICREFAQQDARIRYHRNPKNVGAAENYNLGFKLARGEYLKWCAHDDYISANYLELAVKALDQHPDAVLTYGPSEMIDENGAVAPPESATLVGFENVDPVWRFDSMIRSGGSCGAIFGLFRRSALARSLLHNKDYYSSDRALLAEMAILGPFIFVPEITFFNRAHSRRSMSLNDKRLRMTWQNTDRNKRYALEHLPLLRQQFAIAWRHRELAGLHRTMPRMIAWILTPMQLSRYGAELLSILAPRGYVVVRTTIHRLVAASRGIHSHTRS
jgi:glycosyltransferase involved in cell wall biosynthesis